MYFKGQDKDIYLFILKTVPRTLFNYWKRNSKKHDCHKSHILPNAVLKSVMRCSRKHIVTSTFVIKWKKIFFVFADTFTKEVYWILKDEKII